MLCIKFQTLMRNEKQIINFELVKWKTKNKIFYEKYLSIFVDVVTFSNRECNKYSALCALNFVDMNMNHSQLYLKYIQFHAFLGSRKKNVAQIL